MLFDKAGCLSHDGYTQFAVDSLRKVKTAVSFTTHGYSKAPSGVQACGGLRGRYPHAGIHQVCERHASQRAPARISYVSRRPRRRKLGTPWPLFIVERFGVCGTSISSERDAAGIPRHAHGRISHVGRRLWTQSSAFGYTRLAFQRLQACSGAFWLHQVG